MDKLGATETTSSTKQAQHTNGGDAQHAGIIDCDIHHDWPSDEALYPYLSDGWREFVVTPTKAGLPAIPLFPTQICANPGGATGRADAFPEGGGNAGSDLALMQKQLLEPSNVERGILTYGSGFFVGSHPNPYLAPEVARAANDWTIDHWLSGQDERLYGTILLATQQPGVAAAEIRRIGGHPRIAAVLLCSSGLGKPFGHPVYHEIYAAAVEQGLPVALHVGGEAAPQQGTSIMAGGMPSFYFEVYAHMAHAMMSHLTSMILNGVFEKFPDLRLMMVESRVGWVPWFLWNLDQSYRALRREVPWVTRPPSEYVYEHVRFTTQPLDDAPSAEDLTALLKMFDAQNMLCFSSDYPHWDGDAYEHAAMRLPKEWHNKIFAENAKEFFAWDGQLAKAGDRIS